MAEPILDYESFFEGAKNALLELDTLSTEEQRLSLESDRISKAIDSEKKATEDKIADTTAKRLKEITSTYDSEIKKAEEQKRLAEAKKEKAKNKKINERISDNTRSYFTFYFPHKFFDYIKILITVVVLFLGLPVLIYKLIPEHKPIYLPFIYFVIVLITGGLYIIIGNLTKARHRDSLMKIRAMRDNIDHDMKRIVLITKDINNDSADDRYDLSSFDNEILAVSDKLSDLNEKRNAAVSDFENNTKKVITDEIRESSREKLESLGNELEMTKKSLSSIADRRSQINLTISDKYESYLGRGFLNTEKIDALQKLITDGEANNISEAIDLYERRQNG